MIYSKHNVTGIWTKSHHAEIEKQTYDMYQKEKVNELKKICSLMYHRELTPDRFQILLNENIF